MRQHLINSIENIQSEFSLHDIWRIKNPTTLSSTWSKNSPFYILSLHDLVTQVDIIASIKTDHSAVVLCTYQFKAGGGGGRAWGGDLTFFKNLPSNALPTGKPLQSNAQKFPHPGWHIAVNHSQAGCKKDARKTGKLYNFHLSTLLRLQRRGQKIDLVSLYPLFTSILQCLKTFKSTTTKKTLN